MSSLAAAANDQLSILTGRKIKTPYNQIAISKLPAYRDAAAAATALKADKEQFEKTQAFQEEQAAIAEDQANKSSMIQLGNTALSLAASKDTLLPMVKSAGNTVYSLAGAAKDLIFKTAAEKAAEAAAETAVSGSTTIAGTEAAGTGITEGASNLVTKKIIETGAEEASSTAGGSLLSGVSSAVSTAAPYYAAAKLGGTLINAITDNNPGLKETPFGRLGRSLEHPITGVEKAWGDMLAESGVGDKNTNRIIAGILNPVGGVIEALGGGCIIVTACTDRNSPEVEITREYRDKFLSREQLRGYYIIAEKTVPLIKSSKMMKKIFKYFLVDSLIEYGRHALGKTTAEPGVISHVVTKSFLWLCQRTGETRKSFMRANGEVF